MQGVYDLDTISTRPGRKKHLIYKSEVYQILFNNIFGKYHKKQITKLIESYGDVVADKISKQFGWSIPGVVNIKFVDKQGDSDDENITFYPYNSAILIQEAANKADLDYLGAEYIINEYFDICFFLLSKGYGPTLCDIFTTNFSESHLHTVFFTPTTKIKTICDEKGLKFSSKVVIKKYQSERIE